MSSKKVIRENEKAPKGHGPGGGTWGVKGDVGNKCPSGAGKGQIGKTIPQKVRSVNSQVRGGKE